MFSSSHFGQGTGSIFLDSVGCVGTEDRLIDCIRASSVICFNGHAEDAGVRCQIESTLYQEYLLLVVFISFIRFHTCVCLNLWYSFWQCVRLRSCSSCWWVKLVRGKSWGLYQQCLGNCLWWFMGHNWCHIDLQAARICIHIKYVNCHLIGNVVMRMQRISTVMYNRD